MDGPGNGDVTAKGVTADDNGNIIVMGDFDESTMYVRNAQGNIVSVLSNLGNTDNYYIMYDHDGDVSFSNSSLLSSVNDDEAGGLNHYYDQTTQCTEVFFTGRKNGNGFLGKRFTLTPSPTITFTQSNEYTIPGPIYIPIPLLYSGHFGKSVDTYVNQTNGVRTIFFSGKSINQVNTGSEPFLFYSLQPAPSSTPVQLDKGYHYVAQVAQLQNSSTDLAIRQSSGELYMGGYTKEPGNYPAYPGMGGYINGVNDFFIFKSAIYSNAAGVTVPQQWGVPVNSDASHTAVFELGQSVPEFFSVCVDENLPCPGYGQGRAYITGSYNSSLSSNQLAAGISFPVTNVVSPYIARLVDGLPQLFGLIKCTDLNNKQDVGSTFELSITPNPAILSAKCCIDGLDNLVASVKISTIDGMSVLSMKDVAFSNGCADINLSSLPSGEYFITVVNGNNKSSGKLIKID